MISIYINHGYCSYRIYVFFSRQIVILIFFASFQLICYLPVYLFQFVVKYF